MRYVVVLAFVVGCKSEKPRDPVVAPVTKTPIPAETAIDATTATPDAAVASVDAPTIDALVDAMVLDAGTTPDAPKVSIQPKAKPCYVGGCGGEMCSDKQGVNTTCVVRPNDHCFQGQTCERQKGGGCGWTMTPALRKCLNLPPERNPLDNPFTHPGNRKSP